MPEVRLGTDMFLIARERMNWQAGTMPTAKPRRERQISAAVSRATFSRKEGRHEYDSGIKDGLVDLHRQMDTQDFVFAKRQTSSPWAVAPPARASVAAYADQNSPQSRIRGFNRETCDAIEGHHCRVFADQTGTDNHCSTPRHVPLGKAIPHGRERRRRASGWRNRVSTKPLEWTCPSRRARCASRKENHTTIDKDMNIDNKTILTTCASRGIGRAQGEKTL